MIAEEQNINREIAIDFDGTFGHEASLCINDAEEPH
jgi:hypothetical protein